MKSSLGSGSISRLAVIAQLNDLGSPSRSSLTTKRPSVSSVRKVMPGVSALLPSSRGRRSISVPDQAPPSETAVSMNSHHTGSSLANGYPPGLVEGSLSRQNEYWAASWPIGTWKESGIGAATSNLNRNVPPSLSSVGTQSTP